MATALQLAQKLARESGTVSGSGQPPSFVGQTGRLAKVVGWVADAWVDIQNSNPTWFFRQAEFTSALLVGNGEYTDASFSIADLFKFKGNATQSDLYTCYDPAVGASDEQPLNFMEWDNFNRRFRRGVQTNARPGRFSIAPDGNLWVGPAPDKAYVFKGEYVKSAQVLAANTDVPICPADFHYIIVWYALVYLVEHDEAGREAMASAGRKYGNYMRDLSRDQLPTPSTRGSSLA